MNRSTRLRKQATRHGLISVTFLMAAIAAITWMCVSVLHENALWAIIALCTTVLCAFVTWVEGYEFNRLYSLSEDETLHEIRRAATFPIRARGI